jgi:hypothetical protein
VALGGCGSSSSSTTAQSTPTGDFAGKLAGGQAFVAVIAGKANVVAYVCDGRHGIAELFTGQRSGGSRRVVLRNRHGAQLTATVAATSVTGTFAPAGNASPVKFAATPAHRPAGFYRARGRAGRASATAGWVVLPDGAQRGAATIGSKVVAAPAISPTASTATLPGGVRVTLVRISTATGADAGLQGGQIGQFGG